VLDRIQFMKVKKNYFMALVKFSGMTKILEKFVSFQYKFSGNCNQ